MKRTPTTRERLRFAAQVFKTTADRWTTIEGFRLGAAFSFYATFSIFPLLLLLVSMVGFVVGNDAVVRDRILASIADPSSRDLVDQTLSAMQASSSARGASAIVGLLTLLFSASGAMVELDATMNRIWGVEEKPVDGVLGAVREFVTDRLAGFALVAGIGGSMVGSLVLSSVVESIVEHAPARAMTPALLQTTELTTSIVFIALVMAATFHYVPDVRPPFKDVFDGALLTAVLLTLLRAVFATYLSRMTSYAAYGVVGSVLGLAMWIYLSSQVIFLGATFTSSLQRVAAQPPAGDVGPAVSQTPSKSAS